MSYGNDCPVAGCTAKAKPKQLMCWPHWRRVPKSLNRAVFETFAAFQRDAGNVAKRASYKQARDAAIAAVEEKEMHEREVGA